MSVLVAVVVLLLLPHLLRHLLLLLLLLLLPLPFRCRSRLVALPGYEDARGSAVPSPAVGQPPTVPCSADAHGRSCQKGLRIHYTIATLPPCTAAIFLVSARRLAQRAAANRTSFCPASACRTPPTPHSTRTVSPPQPSAAAAPLSLSLSLFLSVPLSLCLSSPRSPPTPRGLLPSPPSAVERDTSDRHRLWSYGGRGTKYR